MDFNIRDTCISIMECSEIERRTIPVDEVGGEKWSTQRKATTFHKSLTNFIT